MDLKIRADIKCIREYNDEHHQVDTGREADIKPPMADKMTTNKNAGRVHPRR